ncbi:uncharacterized protein JCM15063_001664 [Sporobolomyces koalae]|uniref:uncharacterized protein n=1 Tax=Sporobolomyces koalae TaxID=500713 RepID=UPI003179D39A
MSIFASTTAAPAVIEIPAFSSPVHPHRRTAIDRDADNEKDHSTSPPRPSPEPLSRDEARQKRFRNTTTKWESLGRMIEEHKASGTSSLLQLMGGNVNIASALGGNVDHRMQNQAAIKNPFEVRADQIDRGKRQEKKNNKRVKDAVPREKSLSPKRPRQERKHREISGQRADAIDKTGTSSTTREAQQEVPRSIQLNPNSSSQVPSTSRVTLDKVDELQCVPEPRRGRVPRAALRRAETTEGTTKCLDTRHQATNSATDSKSIEHDANQTQSVKMVSNNPFKDDVALVTKGRKLRPLGPADPRLPLPASVATGTTTASEISSSKEKDVQGHRGADPKKDTAVKKGKPASAIVPTESDDVTADDDTTAPKKPRKEQGKTTKLDVAGKKRKTVPDVDTELQPRTIDDTEKRVNKVTVAKKSSQGKKRANPLAQEESASPPSPPLKKSRKKTPHAAPSSTRSPSPSPATDSIPPLLYLPSAKAIAIKGKSKTKDQRTIRSERLVTALLEAKPNLFDLLVEGTRFVLERVLEREELDEDDQADQPKVQALKRYVARLRFSLLHRSAHLSEYSELQRRLTATKARSKKLKAELDAARETPSRVA